MSRDITKPTKWVCALRRRRSTWASVQPDQESSLSAWRKLGPFATHWAQAKTLIRLGGCPGWSEFRWAHSHFVGFVMSWLIYQVWPESSLSVWKALCHWLPTERTAKTLIRLDGCQGWFESSFGAGVILLVLSCTASFIAGKPWSWCRCSCWNFTNVFLSLINSSKRCIADHAFTFILLF